MNRRGGKKEGEVGITSKRENEKKRKFLEGKKGT